MITCGAGSVFFLGGGGGCGLNVPLSFPPFYTSYPFPIFFSVTNTVPYQYRAKTVVFHVPPRRWEKCGHVHSCGCQTLTFGNLSSKVPDSLTCDDDDGGD